MAAHVTTKLHDLEPVNNSLDGRAVLCRSYFIDWDTRTNPHPPLQFLELVECDPGQNKLSATDAVLWAL
jgi:hypothetical protein